MAGQELDSHEHPEFWNTLLEFLHEFRYSTHHRLDTIMANLDALNTAVTALVAEDASVVTALNDLKSKIEDPALQAEIDAITSKITGVSNDINTAIQADDGSAPAPAPEPTPAPATGDNPAPTT
jgi:hypothetical protein